LLTQLLQNLVSNALRYSAGATPEIDVWMTPAASGMELCVADNGPGVPEAFRSEIFQPFKRLVGREIEGSGLGLAICRRIAELHGATIRCDGGPSGGAVFIVAFAS
jgi:signal transduction histidine kinase